MIQGLNSQLSSALWYRYWLRKSGQLQGTRSCGRLKLPMKSYSAQVVTAFLVTRAFNSYLN